MNKKDTLGNMIENGADSFPEYIWENSKPACIHKWVLPALLKLVRQWPESARVIDMGCGNGFLASELAGRGMIVTGIDPSVSGITNAKLAHPKVDFRVGSVYDNLCDQYEKESFDIVLSVDVIEHLFDPRVLVRNAFELLKPDGRIVIVTPYHGYLKNLILALTGEFDRHFTALWDGGHIKFWSRKTLTLLLDELKFTNIRFKGVGRFPYLWKSMIIHASKS